MELEISVEDLLNKRKIESDRIEFKAGWNPDDIYHSVCAFANDYNNDGGGYIVVGVEEKNGIAVRPVKGILEYMLDEIQKEMLSYNNMISPPYFPKVIPLEVDGKWILVIVARTGQQRPYKSPEHVTGKKDKKYNYYIRYLTSSVKANAEQERELINMSDQTPYDCRANHKAIFDDISPVLLEDHLRKTGSKLAKQVKERGVEEILEDMQLLVGPPELRYIQNVAIMMFCEHPDRFFPYTYVQMTSFPQGSIENPSVSEDFPNITGSVPQMIQATMERFRNLFIREKVIKVPNQMEALRIMNYPYQAIEEAVVNAFYHRDYMSCEPVTIEIEPDCINIMNFPGIDRSISEKTIAEGKRFVSRHYRNRRLGEFLKELDLSEGHSSGIPTIQEELEKNGSYTLQLDGADVVVEAADVEIFSEDIPGWLVANEGKLTVALDVTVTEELRREGIARELVNRIQNIRKSSGLEITDKIKITLSKNQQTDDAVNEYKDYICNQVLGTSLTLTDEVENGTELNFDDFSLYVSVVKE